MWFYAVMAGLAALNVGAGKLAERCEDRARYLDELKKYNDRVIAIINERMNLHEQYRKLLAKGEIDETDEGYIEHLKWLRDELPELQKTVQFICDEADKYDNS